MMKKERIGFMLLAFLAIFSFAGIYGGFVTGTLGKIALIDPPAEDYFGLVQKVVPMEDVSFGDVVYITSTSGPGYPYVAKADADATTTLGDIRIMVASANSMGPAPSLAEGIIHHPAYAFTSAGLPVHVSNTAGLCTTVDLSTGEYRQIIGYSQSPGVLKFSPSYDVNVVPGE